MIVTVGDFHAAARERLSLVIESGEEHLSRVIHERAINRPGLALAGFLPYFANRRIQVMGLAEFAYLKSLSLADQRERLDGVFSKNIPCLALTRNRHPLPSILEAAERRQTPLFRTPMITSEFINAATLCMENLLAPQMRFQGTMVDIQGIGVMIEGPPGVGKSETALALIERGNSLVADDVTLLRKNGAGEIIASPLELTRYHLEIRGLGIVHVPSLFGVASMRKEMKLDLIASLHPWDPAEEYDRTGLAAGTRNIMGVDIPLVILPVAPGRDIAHIIEVAALNQRLRFLGHDAAKELDERLVSHLVEIGHH